MLLGALLTLGACLQDPEPALPVQDVTSQTLDCDDTGQLALFEQRIAPLLDEERPASCGRCHLPGTNLAAFIRPDPCEAMACLTQQHLVNLKAPADSKLLDWIVRGHAAAGLTLEDDPIVRAEYAAIKEWIDYSSRCHEPVCGQLPNACGWSSTSPFDEQDMGAGDMPDMAPVLGPCGEETCPLTSEHYGCEPDEITRAFFDHPWFFRGRCEHCHAESSDYFSDPLPPKWLSDDRGIAGAEWTVEQVLTNGYVNLERPERSLLLLKPLSPNAGGIPHGGGTKVLDTNDFMYQATINWVKHVKACRQGTL